MNTRWLALLLPAALFTACGPEKPDDGTAGTSDDTGEATGTGDGSGDDGGPGSGDDGGSGSGDDGGSGSGSGDTGSDAVVDAIQAPCDTVEEGVVALVEATQLEATVTWSLDFDADAEAAGWVDCSYTRTFTGTQRLDLEHICPQCDVLVEGTAVMTEGFEDCAEPLFGGSVERTETWGLAGTDVYRRGGAQLPLTGDPLTTLEALSESGAPVPLSWSSEYGVNNEDGDEVGRFELAASGDIAWATDPETLIEEPFGPRGEPYACGWECNDPGSLGGEYPLAPAEVVPNARFTDQCGEGVDLHDFYGSYVVLDSAQSDCGPCLAMADAADEFKATMTAKGIPVRLIPLLGNGLADVAGTPSEATHQAWVDRFDSHEPVLADRGWGYAALGAYLPEYSDTDIAWPAWIILGPDLTVVEADTGFGSWDSLGAIIEADWAARGESGPLP